MLRDITKRFGSKVRLAAKNGANNEQTRVGDGDRINGFRPQARSGRPAKVVPKLTVDSDGGKIKKEKKTSAAGKDLVPQLRLFVCHEVFTCGSDSDEEEDDDTLGWLKRR